MSAPGASPAPVFRPGVPGGSIASNGGSPFVPALNDPTVPPGIAEGARDGRAPILADPRLPVGTSSGIGQGPGTGPARPAHGPISVGGPQVVYPRLAAKEGNSGTVIIAVNVSPDGVPLSVTIEKRSEADALDNTALAAAKKWTFRPAEDGHGKTVASKARLEFRFEVGKEPEVQQL